MTNGSIVFDRAVDYYDQTRGFPPGQEQRAAELIAQVGNFSASSHLLEIGVGTGRIALPMLPHVGAYYGIDLSRPMMDRLRAKQAASSHDGKYVRLLEADVARIPFADSSFDGAVAVHIFHLVPDQKAVLHELKRVLKPGAVLVMGRNRDREHLNEIYEIMNAAVPRYRAAAPKDSALDQFLLDAGWERAGELHEMAYTSRTVPLDFVDQIAQRRWSHLWHLSDDEIAQLVQVATEAIKQRFPDPEKEIDVQAAFEARAYRPIMEL